VTWPPTYRVGYRDLKLKTWDHVEARMAQLSGQTNAQLGVTCVDVSKDQCEQANTILHEVIHNVLTLADCLSQDDDAKANEQVCTVIANGLCAFARDNPSMWAMIAAALTPEEPAPAA